jgi:hypothetical protein
MVSQTRIYPESRGRSMATTAGMIECFGPHRHGGGSSGWPAPGLASEMVLSSSTRKIAGLRY